MNILWLLPLLLAGCVPNSSSPSLVSAIQLQYSRLASALSTSVSSAGNSTPINPASLPQNGSTPAPTPSAPVPPASVAATPAPSGTLITVNPGAVLHNSTSHVIGVNRNHIAGQSWSFANGAAKMQAMLQLTPTWAEKKMLYRIGHGPTDGRLDMGAGYDGFHFLDHFGSASAYPFDSASYPYDDLRNALSEANSMNADQIHVINFGTSDATEAGTYLGYLNQANDPNRAAHPFAQQNAKLFELGNEISWDQVRGHAQFAPDEITYATRAKLFSQAMRAHSDVPIKIGAVLSANLSLTGNGWSGPGTVTQNILTTMDTQVDFLTYHGYSGWPMAIEPGSQPASMSVSDAMESFFAQVEYHRGLIENQVLPVIKNYNLRTGRDVFLANTEFLSSYHDADTARGMFGALYSADQTVEAINHDIRTSVNFCFSHQDMADSLMFLNDDPTQLTSVFRFLRLLAQHWGDKVIASSSSNLASKTFSNSGFTVNVARLQIAASTNANASKVFLLVVNPLADQDVTASIALPWNPSSTTVYELAGSQGLMSSSAQTAETSGSLNSLQNRVFKRASISILEMTR